MMAGAHKAAVLILSLPPELAEKVLRYLDDPEIERLAAAIASLDRVDAQEREAVLREAEERLGGPEGGGGLAYAILAQLPRGPELIRRLEERLRERTRRDGPVQLLARADPARLAQLLEREHPQVAALVLSLLPPDRAAAVLSSLPPDRQADVVRRMARLGQVPAGAAEAAAGVLARWLEDDRAGGGDRSFEGLSAAVQILQRADRHTERAVLDQLRMYHPELAEALLDRLFLFEDLVRLSDRDLQKVLREVDLKTLALALKTAPETLREKVFRNVSQRTAAALQEELELMDPVRLRQVEEAQRQVVAVVRRLDEQGEIAARPGRRGDEWV